METRTKIYQLSKVGGKYRWTGTVHLTTVPGECINYKWTTDINVVNKLNGKSITPLSN